MTFREQLICRILLIIARRECLDRLVAVRDLVVWDACRPERTTTLKLTEAATPAVKLNDAPAPA
jgi:hypothetical protein